MDIITRSEWGAEHGRGNATGGAKTRIVIHHDGHNRADPDSTFGEESAVVRMFEDFHVNGEPGKPGLTRKNPRIAYSFVIFPSGRIYEGCGWGRIGAHTGGFNSSSYGIQYPINGRVTAPTQPQLDSTTWLREEGVRLGHLSARYTVSGHRDFVPSTDCPGDLVYDAAVRGAAPITAPTVAECVAAMPSLRKGKGGTGTPTDITLAIMEVQNRLVLAGYMTATARNTGPGIFGPATDRSVRAFQKDNGLLVDGIVGKKTWTALRSL